MSRSIDLDAVRNRAQALAEADLRMRRELVALRRDSGLTQQDVAEMLGMTQQAVQKFERYDADPQLSTIRRYASAVGARVTHSVVRDVNATGAG